MAITLFAPDHAVGQSEEVKEVQSFLAEEGYHPGTPDGFIGPRTITALETFQQDRGLSITGEIDTKTLAEIERSKSPAVPVPTTAPVPEVETNELPTGWVIAGFLGLIIAFLLTRGRGGASAEKKVRSKADRSTIRAEVRAPILDLTEPVGTSNMAPTKPLSHSCWIPQGSSLTLSGRDIGGMVYVGAAPKTGHYGERSRGYIDPSLAVAKSGGDHDGEGMPYWPNYSAITPRARATYLDWLASGRADPEFNVGYMFLYFYGLERRFFMDRPYTQEAAAIVDDVKRLKSVYKDNYSAKNYLSRFIDAATVQSLDVSEIVPVFQSSENDLPLSLRLAIGNRLLKGDPLSADWVLSWLMCHPERRLRTPATRCWEEFRALFTHIFDKEYPNGLTVKAPKRLLKATYRAASGEFEAALRLRANGKTVPDISSLRQPLTVAQKIADTAMLELDKYSRFLGRNPDGRGSVEAHALLPQVLWSVFPSSEIDDLRQWCRNIVSGDGFIALSKLVTRLEGQAPDKVTKRQLTGAADALARIGYGVAPDPRFAMRTPSAHEPVILFELGAAVTKLEAVSPAYQKTLTELALAAFVAQADHQVVPQELETLRQIISATGAELRDGEIERLEANLAWLLKVPPNFSLLRRRVSQTDDQTKETLKRIALKMASADNVIQPEEVRSIETIYTALGMDTSALYSDLHVTSTNAELVPMRQQTEGTKGEPIPEPPFEQSQPQSLILDKDVIRETQAQTHEVSKLLQRIFADDAVDEEDLTADSETEGGLAGLAPQQQSFVLTLMERAVWTEQDYDRIASQFGLMPSGALEAVNEWAFEHFDEALIEAYNGYELNQAVIDQIKSRIDRGGA
ncbi:MAG: TerB N-terminal domain-containing protein [Henriciella sp.]|nr:TerB N-terminal domain-containing protein [Henriciella sp.]MBO6695703.1 TerB N-terminal domain-containing protein [Henriciella sp.]